MITVTPPPDCAAKAYAALDRIDDVTSYSTAQTLL